MKTCIKCLAEQDEGEFYPHARMKDGRKKKCRSCLSLEHKAKYQVERNDPALMAKMRITGRDNSFRRYQKFKLAGKAHMLMHRSKDKPEDAHKRYARGAFYRSVRDGKLIRPLVCEWCGVSSFVIGHHPDYSKPFEVNWICRTCHGIAHRKSATMIPV